MIIHGIIPTEMASSWIHRMAPFAPHFLQNRAPSLTGALQAGQSSSSLRPHCSQKAESEGFSLPQFEHHIVAPGEPN
jgi:hypothetical protein